MSEETGPTAAAEDDKNSVSQPEGPGAIVELEDGTVLGDGVTPPTLPVAKKTRAEKIQKAVPKSIQEALGLPTEPYAVVGSGDTDPVDLSKVVYQNIYHKKSLSVFHIQRRLREFGYVEVDMDNGGWYGDGTRNAIARFQKANKWDETGELTREQLEKLFDSDPNVHII